MYTTSSFVVLLLSLSQHSVSSQALVQEPVEDICPCESVTSLQHKIAEMTEQIESQSSEATLRERLIEDLQLDVATLRVEMEYMMGPANQTHEVHVEHGLTSQPTDEPVYSETTSPPTVVDDDFDLNKMTLAEISNFARGVHEDLKTLRNKQMSFENELEVMHEQIERASVQATSIRLAGSLTAGEGRIEVLYDGVWSTVCDDSWGYEEAKVVCNQLGFHFGGQPLAASKYGGGIGPILLDNVHCYGNESNILDCSNKGLFVNDCSHSEDAGVQCYVEGSVRLAGSGSDERGRIEILHDGDWGTICDDSWGDSDATVACRQLGFSTGEAVDDAAYGEGTGQVLLDEVDCNGHEAMLIHCGSTTFGEHNCDHSEDAGVICH